MAPSTGNFEEMEVLGSFEAGRLPLLPEPPGLAEFHSVPIIHKNQPNLAFR